MSKLRVLVVEDELIIAYLLTNIISRSGYEPCGPVMSGEEAILKAGEVRPALILMDFKLRTPMNGLEAAQTIWERHRIPCLFLSAFAATRAPEINSCPGFLGMLSKPIEEAKLSGWLKKVLA